MKPFTLFQPQEELEHPEIISNVRESLKKFGTLDPSITDNKSEDYWMEFSDTKYDAGYLEYDEQFVEEFAWWFDELKATESKQTSSNAIIFDGTTYVPDKTSSLDGHQCKYCALGRICGCGDEYYCNIFGGYPFKKLKD